MIFKVLVGLMLSTTAYGQRTIYADSINSNTSTGSICVPITTVLDCAEVSSLDGVTSNIQTQIDGKQTSGSYITGLTGDVSAAGPGSVSATVNSVGGSLASSVNTGVVTANAATSANTASTVVKRDALGNFTAGNITAGLTGTASGNPPNTRAINTTSPITGGGDLSTDKTIAIPAATASINGYLSSADWSIFNGKADLTSPAFIGIPTAPTASVGTSTTQLATTAFVLGQGFLGATGSMPSATSATLVTTTSATTTFVTAITASITVTASSAPVMARCVLDLTSATSASVATTRVTINAVAGGSVTESLTVATTQHLTVPNQYISASLGPGTYTVNCDFNRASGSGTVTVAQGSLNAIALQGSSSNGITQLTGALQAGPGSGSQVLSGILPLANGGTNANITAANGAIPYSTASAFALLAPGSLGQVLRSGGAGAPTWTAQTYPASTTINQLMYSSANNIVAGLATANTGALVTSSTGVPSIAAGATANRLLRTNGTTVSFAQAALATDVSGTLPVANGGTGLASAFASGRVMFSNGATNAADANFTWDTTNQRLGVGGFGTAVGNFVNPSGSKTVLQAYNSGTGNAFQAVNTSAYTAALISRQANATSGASIGLEFGRGTPAAPSGALSGDQIGVIVATPDASSGAAFGYSGSISFIASETATTTATGGEIVLGTTPNTTLIPIERVRVTNDGIVKITDGHLKTVQTTAPTALVNANAGTGGSCSVNNATDVAGQISVTTGTLGISTGSYCAITFNKTYAVAPICLFTPANASLSTSVYATSSTSALTVNFAAAGGISTTYLLNYHCIETQ